jgi:hypothetical protein
MARAIALLSGSAAVFLPRPFAVFAALWHEITHRYRPEQHYMRGPGPAWHAKHDQLPSA